MSSEQTDITPETPQPTQAPGSTLKTYLFMATTILVVIGLALWWMGSRQGWDEIGKGGANEQLVPRVGEEVPELVTLREDGQPFVLSQLRGTPVWLNFWGSWCQPCRAEMPDIQNAYESLQSTNVQLIAISMGEAPEDAINYRNVSNATFPVYIDPGFMSSFATDQTDPSLVAMLEGMRNDWQIHNFPTHVFIGADGIVKAVTFSPLTYPEMMEYVRMISDDAPSSPAASPAAWVPDTTRPRRNGRASRPIA